MRSRGMCKEGVRERKSKDNTDMREQREAWHNKPGGRHECSTLVKYDHSGNAKELK